MKRLTRYTTLMLAAITLGGASGAALAQVQMGDQPVKTPPLELASKPVPATADKIAFMSGCWQADGSGGVKLTEAWFAPQSGVMMGMGHTVRAGKVIMAESMRLFEEAGTLKLWMQPTGRGALTMALDSVKDDKAAEFGVKEGDTVTKVAYRLADKDVLEVDFRTQKDADRRGVNYSFKRIDCGSLFAAAVAAKK